MSAIVVPEVNTVTNTVTNTVITTDIIQLTQIHIHSQEKGHSLRPMQVEVLNDLYSVAKQSVKEIVSLHSMDHAMKIGRMVAELVKLTEKASYRGEKIPGAEKKEIALELGQRLLKDPEVIDDETLRNGLLTVYDLLGEQMLDTVIDVSQHVNTVIKEVAVSCCEALLKLLK